MKDLSEYSGAFLFLSSLGGQGCDLADFIKTYGLQLAALQLGVDQKALTKALVAMNALEGLGKTLVEVRLQRGSERIPMTDKQRTPFVQLLEGMREAIGTTELGRRLGCTRQALYAAISSGGPIGVSNTVLSCASLLGFTEVLAFLEKLEAGVPSFKHVTETRRVKA
jgi:hypothetical protein